MIIVRIWIKVFNILVQNRSNNTLELIFEPKIASNYLGKIALAKNLKGTVSGYVSHLSTFNVLLSKP